MLGKNLLKNRKTRVWLLIALLAACFLIRFYNAGALSGGDDSGYASWVYYALQKPSRLVYLSMPDQPIYYQAFTDLRNFSIIPVVPFVLLLGYTTTAMRMASLIFAVLSALMLYLIAKRYFDYRISMLAVLLLVFSPIHIAFTRVAFVDSALTFYSMLIIYLVIRGIEEEKNYLFYLATVFSVFSLLTTNFRGAVPLVCLLPFALLSRPTRKQWTHLIVAGLLVPVIYIGYALLPVLWGNYGYIDIIFQRVAYNALGKAVSRNSAGFLSSFIRLGKYLYFTVFFGLIALPALFGVYFSAKKIKKPIFALLVTYFASSIVFFLQGSFFPSRQTFYAPVLALLASIGIFSIYGLKKKRSIGIITLASFYVTYMILVVIISLTYVPDTSGIRDSIASLIGSGAYNALVVISLGAAGIFFIAPIFIMLSSRITGFLEKSKDRVLWFGKAALWAFIIINVAVPAYLVAGGVGIYHRSEAINSIADYLNQHKGDELYGCVAGIHSKTLTYLLQKPCADWLQVDRGWLDENARNGSVKYFLVNTGYGTPGLAAFLPDGSIDTQANSSYWGFRKEKWDWLMNNTADITAETSLGAGNGQFILREYSK